ncbi:MAG: hypothetical protein NUW22_11590 [Acidobacteria bacterium]|nr:hypothetical protein [Acidobacteriota bacterium]
MIGLFDGGGRMVTSASPPGDYIVRAIVAAQGQLAGRVVRTLRKIATVR